RRRPPAGGLGLWFRRAASRRRLAPRPATAARKSRPAVPRSAHRFGAAARCAAARPTRDRRNPFAFKALYEVGADAPSPPERPAPIDRLGDDAAREPVRQRQRRQRPALDRALERRGTQAVGTADQQSDR